MTRPARFRLTAPVVPEDDLHAAVARALDLLLLAPAEWTTFPAGGYGLTPQAAARLTRIGLKPAWPDILLVHDARIFGIELKTERGRLSITRTVRTQRGGQRTIIGQREMHPRLHAAGMSVVVCRSLDEVLGWLGRWNIPTRVRQPQSGAIWDGPYGSSEAGNP